MHVKSAPRPVVTPAQVEDLAAARDAAARVRATADIGLSRWPRVRAVQGHLERIRRENHLADDLRLIFRDTW